MDIRSDNYRRERETGSARVYKDLKCRILRLELEPGHRLDESALSIEYSLSRSPIREALGRLSGEGLVMISPNRTTTVASMDLARMAEYLDALELLQRTVTRMAAINRSNVDMERIYQAQLHCKRSILLMRKSCNPIGFIEADSEFHLAIAAACKNNYFAEPYGKLLMEGQRMLHLHHAWAAQEGDERDDSHVAEHDDIIKAIERRDADGAELHALRHAEGFRVRLTRYLDRNLSRSISLCGEVAASSR
ncbi:FCD domain-containing protein [Pseudomonas sp. NPDC008258]|uniref:GntR family transcriptional regulator n=1 Tax=Pseudomonas sp. NPDC008258 TaxID=3364418 RepID=UPI0036E93AA1